MGEEVSGGGSALDTISTALTSAFTTTAGDILDAIGTILPIVLPIVGAFVLIGLAIKVFKVAKRG